MTERVEKLLGLLKSKEYKKLRGDYTDYITGSQSADVRLELFLQNINAQKAVIFEGDRIGFNRYTKNINRKYYSPGNTAPDYGYYLKNGLGYVYKHLENIPDTAEEHQKAFAERGIKALKAIFSICEKYKESADGELKSILEKIPYNPAQSYHEALVMLKIIIFALRLNYNSHITLGRFDQYMYPYYLADIEKGVTKEEISELTQEFFINLNFDTDLYFGMQVGDNGQSMMLGGLNIEGEDCYNELSEICMKASMELNLIDPKINLRVSSKTPKERYVFATEMTKMGLGFPQYNNDDIVIPGLIKLGYAPEDAYNYSVAACWEYIVPDSYDYPNIRALNFPLAVNNALDKYLEKCESFEQFKGFVKKEIIEMCDEMCEWADTVPRIADTLFSLFIPKCVINWTDCDKFKDYYCNFGFHGAGIANAADALCAIEMLIFEEKSVTVEELKKALSMNFEGHTSLRNRLLGCPKMGNNDDRADSKAEFLMDTYCNSLAGRKNRFGGIIRPGTGSAMEYIRAAQAVGATADGRLSGTPFSSSFSPAITTNLSGVLSVIQSFTKFDMTRIINGGPLTIEIHDNTFRNDYGVEKVAELVRMFVELGGQQLQLNAINGKKLLEAQKNPQLYPNLIVRVWGWSGYFNELDKEYQDHIIARTQFNV